MRCLSFILMFLSISFAQSENLVHIVTVNEFEDTEFLLERQEEIITYCNGVLGGAYGLPFGGTFEFGIRLTPTELGPYAGWNLIAVSWYHCDGSSPNGQINIYDQGSPSNPGSLLHSQPYSGVIAGWNRADLTTQIPIDGNSDLWCTIEMTHPAGVGGAAVDTGPAVPQKGNWGPFGQDSNWTIHAVVRSEQSCEEKPIVKPITKHENIGATVISGPLLLPEGRKCKIFDITGRVVAHDRIKPGIYFIEIDGKITKKVAKVR